MKYKQTYRWLCWVVSIGWPHVDKSSGYMVLCESQPDALECCDVRCKSTLKTSSDDIDPNIQIFRIIDINFVYSRVDYWWEQILIKSNKSGRLVWIHDFDYRPKSTNCLTQIWTTFLNLSILPFSSISSHQPPLCLNSFTCSTHLASSSNFPSSSPLQLICCFPDSPLVCRWLLVPSAVYLFNKNTHCHGPSPPLIPQQNRYKWNREETIKDRSQSRWSWVRIGKDGKCFKFSTNWCYKYKNNSDGKSPFQIHDDLNQWQPARSPSLQKTTPVQALTKNSTFRIKRW